MTFGLKRTEILSAQVNGISLLVLAVLVSSEAARRLIEPPQVEGSLVLAVESRFDVRHKTLRVER